jgi:hypothetical protein
LSEIKQKKKKKKQRINTKNLEIRYGLPNALKGETYKEVTRELSHLIPSHLLPQGSVPSQFGGVFVISFIRESRPLTASEIIR